jgi:ArsR family transcriptional regulator
MDLVFKALADPTRREILRLLNAGEMTAGQIAEHFPITGPSLSHHFNVLKQADLIAARRDGQQIYYSVTTRARSVFEMRIEHALCSEDDRSGLDP